MDASPEIIGSSLINHKLGIVLKTHDGVEWMSKYDHSPYAVSGPAQVSTLSAYYETAGIPFHTWCVVKGVDPVREASMASEVVAAGARTLYLDLEPHAGFWQGTAQDAATYVRELRRLQPSARVILSLDPRPWIMERFAPGVFNEFVAIANELAPQQYWRTFDTSGNHDRYREKGYQIGPEGVTPELLVQATHDLFSQYGLPITPTGQGATDDLGQWHRFLDASYAAGSTTVSVWRYGVANQGLWPLLLDRAPVQPEPPQPVVYFVEPGDTLGAIAARYGTTVQTLVELNGLADPNYLYVGQQLTLPGGTIVQATTTGTAPVGVTTATVAARTHVVAAGDTLYAIAAQYGSSVDAIANANRLADPGFIVVGQTLTIP
jgi:LysM repeat protein